MATELIGMLEAFPSEAQLIGMLEAVDNDIYRATQGHQ